jgi:hypothetical protein
MKNYEIYKQILTKKGLVPLAAQYGLSTNTVLAAANDPTYVPAQRRVRGALTRMLLEHPEVTQ